jgi:hypothetical protein
MSSIGFRCWASEYSWVLVDGAADDPSVIDSGHGKMPVGKSRPEGLVWFRKEVHEILDAHSAAHGFYRAMEGNSRTKDPNRCQMEGVLQEAAYSHAQRLQIESRVLRQIKHDTRFERDARYVRQLASKENMNGLAVTTYSDAFLAALCGLPVTKKNG